MSLPVTDISDTARWQQALSDAVRDGKTLLDMLGLSAGEMGLSEAAHAQFPVLATHSFIARMRYGDASDPLLLQVLASAREQESSPGFSHDPVGEVAQPGAAPGILHKYQGRVLLLVTSACAVHCRYCFRRHFPYADHRNNRDDWDNALNTIAKDSSITEVILSGGDPLVASDAQLAFLVEAIARIPHVKRLRIHSRLPIVLPQRISEPLLDAITAPGVRTTVVVHANHAQEINDEVRAALQQLQQRDISLLNQAVLLADINDTATSQAALSETLFDAGVLPYYLHVLDKVSGAAHFDVPLQKARDIHRGLHATLPGYLVPRLVKEEAGKPGKTLVN